MKSLSIQDAPEIKQLKSEEVSSCGRHSAATWSNLSFRKQLFGSLSTFISAKKNRQGLLSRQLLAKRCFRTCSRQPGFTRVFMRDWAIHTIVSELGMILEHGQGFSLSLKIVETRPWKSLRPFFCEGSPANWRASFTSFTKTSRMLFADTRTREGSEATSVTVHTQVAQLVCFPQYSYLMSQTSYSAPWSTNWPLGSMIPAQGTVKQMFISHVSAEHFLSHLREIYTPCSSRSGVAYSAGTRNNTLRHPFRNAQCQEANAAKMASVEDQTEQRPTGTVFMFENMVEMSSAPLSDVVFCSILNGFPHFWHSLQGNLVMLIVKLRKSGELRRRTWLRGLFVLLSFGRCSEIKLRVSDLFIFDTLQSRHTYPLQAIPSQGRKEEQVLVGSYKHTT